MTSRLIVLLFVKNYFWKIICLCCTGFLLMEIFMDFLKIKPTITSNKKVRLSQIRFPDVLLCFENGFDQRKLLKYGYNASGHFYRGLSKQNNFIGWSGLKAEDDALRDCQTYF